MTRPSLPMLLAVYAALVALWLATYFLAGISIGGVGHLTIALAISTLKTLLVASVFMHLWYGNSLNRVAACAGVFWLAILIGLALCDFFNRSSMAAEQSNPQPASSSPP